MNTCDTLIIGGGIIGLAMATQLRSRHPNMSIVVIEKEPEIAAHSSGRNSGVLHAGFYYTADSLKAKFTRDGNLAWHAFCDTHDLTINRCGKLVIATEESEYDGLEELKRRGDANGIPLEWVNESQAAKIDPNAKVIDRALWSPSTSTVDPVAIMHKLKAQLIASGVEIVFNTQFVSAVGNCVRTTNGYFDCGLVINAAGLYADKVAQHFGFCKHHTLLPFKGLYIKTAAPLLSIRTNIYPVPNLKNPFLGVHFTLTSDGIAKIGPTAIPAFWREHYGGVNRFKFGELLEIVRWEASLFASDAFNFRSLAFEEMKKYNSRYLVDLAAKMVHKLDRSAFSINSKPGIRAQLLDKRTKELVQDFVVEGDDKSVHVLNAVSPAFTCALPFTDWIADQIESGEITS